MKIRELSIQGFRGFNEECRIALHDRLTLIYAPNSYGKTSISESLEWLLYGSTSKVDKADYKEEYKGAYRNRHLPEHLAAFVAVRFEENGAELEYRGELVEPSTIRRFVDGVEVQEWPIASSLATAHRPFILQHALKYLLLAGPDERFRQFAGLLGLTELDEVERNFISLCTKPDSCKTQEISDFLARVNTVRGRLSAQSALQSIDKSLKRGKAKMEDTYRLIFAECRKRVPPNTADDSLLPQLLKVREDAVARIFDGKVELSAYSPGEGQANAADEEVFLGQITDFFTQQYLGLRQLSVVDRVRKDWQFTDLGVHFANETPGICPFCGQSIDDKIWQEIRDRLILLDDRKRSTDTLSAQRESVHKQLVALKDRIDVYYTRHASKCAPLMLGESSLLRLAQVLTPRHEVHYQVVLSAIEQLAEAKGALDIEYQSAGSALQAIRGSIDGNSEDQALALKLGDGLTALVAAGRVVASQVSSRLVPVLEAAQVLKHELDELAGTKDVAVLIELLDKRDEITKSFEIEEALASLKELRRIVSKFVADKIEHLITNELTEQVMDWYDRIKTKGDPDIHFSGFGVERTAKGDARARRVQVKASSYGKDLVSAVSSLSESKLNALGLCLSIATCMKDDAPFGFILIDDPIQSLDAEHETQFIGVVRELVEQGKQVILLSHSRPWLDRVRSGCRSLNGCLYEITQYTASGPHICEVPWVGWKERLTEVYAILNDSGANSVRLQHAEEEIRILAAQVAAELYQKVTGREKSAHQLNGAKVRKMLIECGIDDKLLDRVSETFETTDDAHHAPLDYSPSRQRIHVYYDSITELTKRLQDRKQ